MSFFLACRSAAYDKKDGWKVMKISGSSLRVADFSDTKSKRSETHLKRIRIPGDAWPGFDDVLARLEYIFTLDNHFES